MFRKESEFFMQLKDINYQSQLHRHFQTSPMSAYLAVKHFEEMKLIQKERHHSKTIIKLTDKGKQAQECFFKLKMILNNENSC